MPLTLVMHWLHLLAMVVVLGGYLFLSFFLWPTLRELDAEVRLQVRLLGRLLRRFFTVVVVALMVEILTGGLYLLPATVAAGQGSGALAAFYRLLLVKLGLVFVALLLVPLQLFGLGFRLTRMDAGVAPFDAAAAQRVMRRLQGVSLLIAALLTAVVLLSTRL
ncbi:MAG: hypothetical protein KatS3mg131_1778 [Candidatus Tectimicrobiota bacterium]|nr:MAG: hypothetical protein KatS3mg131_1778 [Candidatus Tectomicrobia bacterium]